MSDDRSLLVRNINALNQKQQDMSNTIAELQNQLNNASNIIQNQREAINQLESKVNILLSLAGNVRL